MRERQHNLTMDLQSLQRIIKSEDFIKLIGCLEDEFLEVKSKPYKLESESGRFELAKDVSAFANAGGGYLLIGVTTNKNQDSDLEIINGFQDFSGNDFNPSQYEGIIKEYVFPNSDDINVILSPVNKNNPRIGIITIPAQKEEKKPFLINKVSDEGEKLKQIVFGYAVRKEASSKPYTVGDIQQLIKKGKESTVQSLTRMEDKLNLILERISDPDKKTMNPSELLDSRLNSLLEDEE